MDENIAGEAKKQRDDTDEAGLNDDRGHWDDLAERLGADISQHELESEAEEPPRAGAPTPTVAPAVKKERKEKRPTPPPRSHWQSLASMLGIRSSKIDEDDPDALDTPAADRESPEEAPAHPPEEPVAEVPKKSFWGWRESKPSESDVESVEGTEPTEEMRAAESPDDLAEAEIADSFGFGLGSAQSMEEEAPKSTPADVNRELGGKFFEPDEEELRQTESQNVLETMFTPSDTSFWEEEESGESTSDAAYGADDVEAEQFESPDDPGHESGQESEGVGASRDGNRGRRRRRRSRQTHSEASRSDTDVSRDEPTRSDAGDGDSEEAETHRRRRRRRRTGRGGRSGSPAEPVTAERSSEGDARCDDDSISVIDEEEQFGPSDSVLRLEACADLFDEPMQTSVPERSRESEHQRDETARGEDDKRRRNSIPTWQDAVGVIVQRNVDSRQEGGSSNANGRRRRGGRRRRPDRRPSSES